MLGVLMLNVIMLSVVTLNAIMPSVVMLNANMQCVVILNAIMLNVEVPQNEIDTCLDKKKFPLKLILTI
jgi:hypothetical protein